MTIEIVDFPIKHGGSFHSYVSLPDDKYMVIWWLYTLFIKHQNIINTSIICPKIWVPQTIGFPIDHRPFI